MISRAGMKEHRTRVLEQYCSVLFCRTQNRTEHKNNFGPRTQNRTEHENFFQVRTRTEPEHWMKIPYEIHVRVHGDHGRPRFLTLIDKFRMSFFICQ